MKEIIAEPAFPLQCFALSNGNSLFEELNIQFKWDTTQKGCLYHIFIPNF